MSFKSKRPSLLTVNSLLVMKCAIALITLLSPTTSFKWTNQDCLYQLKDSGELAKYTIPQDEIIVTGYFTETEPRIYHYTLNYVPKEDIILVKKVGNRENYVEPNDGVLLASANNPQFFEYLLLDSEMDISSPQKFMEEVIDKYPEYKESIFGLKLQRYFENQITPFELRRNIKSNKRLLQLIQNDKAKQTGNPEASYVTFEGNFNVKDFKSISEILMNEMSKTIKNEISEQMIEKVNQMQKSHPKKLEGNDFLNLINTQPADVVKNVIKKVVKQEKDDVMHLKGIFHSIYEQEEKIKNLLTADVFNKNIRKIIENSSDNWILILSSMYAHDKSIKKYSLVQDWNVKQRPDTVNMMIDLHNYLVQELCNNLNQYVTDQLSADTEFENSRKSLADNLNGSIAEIFDPVAKEVGKLWPIKAEDINRMKTVYQERWGFISFVVRQYVESNSNTLKDLARNYLQYTRTRTFANRLYVNGDELSVNKIQQMHGYVATSHTEFLTNVKVMLFDLK